MQSQAGYKPDMHHMMSLMCNMPPSINHAAFVVSAAENVDKLIVKNACKAAAIATSKLEVFD